MAEQENSKDLISVLWSGADVLRSKMDANEYKNYLLGIVFYKYLSDSFLIRVYDLINDEKPESLKVALEAYKNELKGEYANDLLDELKQDRKYVIEPELTYTCFAENVISVNVEPDYFSPADAEVWNEAYQKYISIIKK